MVDAREYHERTNHSPRSIRESPVRMDPSNKPRPVAQSDPVPTCGPPDPAPDPDVHTLCHYATGVTKELDRGGQTVRFRAASCTGKLYHVDLYAVTDDPGEFDPGVYHFDPHTGRFDVLRDGDFRGTLADAAGGLRRRSPALYTPTDVPGYAVEIVVAPSRAVTTSSSLVEGRPPAPSVRRLVDVVRRLLDGALGAARSVRIPDGGVLRRRVGHGLQRLLDGTLGAARCAAARRAAAATAASDTA
ncbi:hypothetical protein BRC93_15265 [Halobacteriales archaeon QS_5_70_15]|nr:MAG: hypothetical protein BRC93_15265 [Halobacteriales archaeon QS_5_70_15]